MLSQTGTYIVLGVLAGIGIFAVVFSVVILRRGKLYHRLSPESRPRRWVLLLLLILLVVFVVWFPVWMTWPHGSISRFLTLLFAITFFAAGITLKWFSGVVDYYIRRKGWPLR